jgi:quercetin dioxygenase-like cupin family protein
MIDGFSRNEDKHPRKPTLHLYNIMKDEVLEFEKSKAHIIVEIIEYVDDSVVIKTIIKKSTGNITAVSIDSGEKLEEKTSPFDTFIQIIDGKAEIIIDGVSKLLETGESIIIPAHSRHSIKANNRFKMISTIIKSGYDEVS